MTQDEIIRMALEAGLIQYVQVEKTCVSNALERFAALVAAHEREKCFDAAMKAAEKAVDVAIALEREACAKVCKDIANSQFESGESETAGVLDHCAAAIRARGETK